MVDEGATGFAMVPTISTLLLQLDLATYPLQRLRYLANETGYTGSCVHLNGGRAML